MMYHYFAPLTILLQLNRI